MDDSLVCRLPEGSYPQNPTWSDRALQQKHRLPEPDYHRLRNLPGGSVRRCPVCVPRIARNDSSGHSPPMPCRDSTKILRDQVTGFYTAWTESRRAAFRTKMDKADVR